MASNQENRFNLVDEPWIPVVNTGLVSLRQIFTDYSLRALGGNPVQKIALLKFFLAIVQTVHTPQDDEEWKLLGSEGFAVKVQRYLDEKKNLFWLYGEKPFLQMPQIIKAEIQSCGALVPSTATGNTTVLNQSQIENEMTDAEKALLVLVMQGFALGGKKTDNNVVLTNGYNGKSNDKGKAATGKPGPSLGFAGYLHNFTTGKSIVETIWLNLFTVADIKNIAIFKHGIGMPPWEKMPEGEDCQRARDLKESYMGRLIPMNRFILLNESGLHYTEGIFYPTYKEGFYDLSIAVDFSKAPKTLWVDPEKKPWRVLTSLLSFISAESNGFNCEQLRKSISRAKVVVDSFGVWSGGIKVSSNAGEQYLTGLDDYVESETLLQTSYLGDIWFAQLKKEMELLDQLSIEVYNSINRFFKRMKADKKFLTGQGNSGKSIFWQSVEKEFSQLLAACDDTSGEQCKVLRKKFCRFVNDAYNEICPKDTARQLDAWAASRPNLSKYCAN